jgi:hypothetical protein
MKRAVCSAVAVLAGTFCSVADANHIGDKTYTGTVSTGQGGTVNLEVSPDGSAVEVEFTGLGNVQATCTGVGFSTGSIPITDHSFSYLSGNGQVSASGTFGAPGTVSGDAQVLIDPCTTGSQAWTAETPLVAPDLMFSKGLLGQGVFNASGKGQTKKASVKPGEIATIGIRTTNGGTDAGSYFLSGCDASKGFDVRYSDDTGSITQDVRDGTYETDQLVPGLEPADYPRVLIQIKASKNAAGKTKTCKLSGDSSEALDTVKVKLKVAGT